MFFFSRVRAQEDLIPAEPLHCLYTLKSSVKCSCQLWHTCVQWDVLIIAWRNRSKNVLCTITLPPRPPIPLPSVSIKPQVSRLWAAITMAAQFSIDDAFALEGDEEGAVSDTEPERWGGKDSHREGGEMTFGPLSFAKPQTHPSPAASATLEHSNLKYQVQTHIFHMCWMMIRL